MAYHAFMSYSHAADGRLAPALQSALHRFAKPWYRLRALRIFRDKTNLHLTPRLWPAIQTALDQSERFILLASPEAAASEWVAREIEHWLGIQPADRILIVLTGGTLEWDDGAGGFDAQRTTALPSRLMSAFTEEPLYLDLTWARGRDDFSSRQPRFRDAVADLAAALQGRAKDELVGEDVRQHRRARMLATSAIVGLCMLTAIAVAAALFAVAQRNVAETQRAAAVEQSRIALARQLAAQSTTILTQFPDRLPLSVLLALESTRLHPSFEGNQALRAGLTLLPRAVLSQAPEHSDPPDRIRAIAFSPDGGRYLAAARDDGTATVIDLVQGKAAAILSHDEHPGTVVTLPGGGFEWKAPGVGKEVIAVAFSPDGRLVATGSNDTTARLWDVATGREIVRLAHEGAVTTVAFHPAGTYLATGTRDGRVRLIEAQTGQQVSETTHDRTARTRVVELRGGTPAVEKVVESTHTAEVREVAFSPDGCYLAAISTDGGISVLDVRTRKERRRWYAGAAGLGLAFSRDGTKLATASGNAAFVWDVDTGKRLFAGTHGQSQADALAPQLWIDDVAFSPDGRYLATAGREGTARLWNLQGGKEQVRLTHPLGVETVSFGRDGATLSTGSYDGARLWELPSGRERWRAAGSNEIVTFSPDGRHVATGGSDGVVSVLSLGRGDQMARMVDAGEIRSVTVSPDGTRLATAANGGELRLWSSAGELMAAAEKRVYGADRLVFSHDGRFLAGSARNPRLFVISLADRLAVTPLATFRDVGDYAVSGRYLAAIAEGRHQVRVWETSGRELPPIEAPNVEALRFDPTGAFLALRQSDGRGKPRDILTWDLARGREVGRLAVDRDGSYALSPQGRFLAVATWEEGREKYSPNHYADVWDMASGTCVSRIPQDDVAAFLAFDRSGSRLVTITGNFRSQQREVGIWTLPAGRLVARFAHETEIDRVRFSPEPDILATLSAGRVYVWNLATGGLLTQLAHAGHVRVLDFSHDGRYLMTGGADGVAALWLLRTEDLRAEACQRLTKNLSSAEWQQYLGTVPYQPSCPNLPIEEPR